MAVVVPQVNGCIGNHPRLLDLCSKLRCPQKVVGGVGRQCLDPVSRGREAQQRVGKEKRKSCLCVDEKDRPYGVVSNNQINCR